MIATAKLLTIKEEANGQRNTLTKPLQHLIFPTLFSMGELGKLATTDLLKFTCRI